MLPNDKDQGEDCWFVSDHLGHPPERIIRSFILESDFNPPSTDHIVRHFCGSVNDIEIRRIKAFFQNCFVPICNHVYENDKHYEIDVDLYFELDKRRTKKRVLIGIEKDSFFNNFRIVGVRHVDKRWQIKRTIFRSKDVTVSWHQAKTMFYSKHS